MDLVALFSQNAINITNVRIFLEHPTCLWALIEYLKVVFPIDVNDP